jgi:large subunit ribosomal protein L15
MIGTKKRKKSTRARGSHTHSRGFKKKARGKGHRGGIGKAGSGKRADHKKTKFVKGKSNKYFGKRITKGSKRVEIKTINLRRIIENPLSFGSEKNGVYNIEFNESKLVGNLEVPIKLEIKVQFASKAAKECVERGGGKVILLKEKKLEEEIKN